MRQDTKMRVKTLYLARHAKAEKGFTGIDDFDRPITERGINDANAVASALKGGKDIPALFISSPAVRALSTAFIFARIMNYSYDRIIIREQIYEASDEGLLSEINAITDEVDSAILFGHNPAFTSVSNLLTGKSIDNVPTSGIVCIEFEADSWKLASAKKGKLRVFITPKGLRG